VITNSAYRASIAELARAVAGAGLLDTLAASAPVEPPPKRNRWFKFGGSK
jgi:hypothetical protein